MWDRVKNFVIGGGFLIMGAIVLAYLEWRVDANVSEAIEALDLSSDANVTAMKGGIAANKVAIASNADNIDDNDEKIKDLAQLLRDVANILMSD